MNDQERVKHEAMAQILKALAHPMRLWIVTQLTQGERCVCEFVNDTDADFSTVSRHLTVLKLAGLVADEKRGKKVFYSLKVPCVINFLACIESVVAER